ncbi:hypothetical protein JCM3775_006180 [Rhodotorula graminis]|uniref:Uncharacterized protein n=1 Tax=Rhodotorula graminis (strain WP1) TaxID=578459 RepID=A0A194S201_RHOGW|nr:uncharacterized protein RHOBADRAFT_37592 [Rhodotorula graminis WP1]KPV74544.1 hypothetical protein RHOBADRAFT_37592 [Rhodotorula graminis WP1]
MPPDQSNSSSKPAHSPYHAFPTPFDQISGDSYDSPGFFDSPHTLQEVDMCALSYALRAKAGWALKVGDPVIRARWRAEALEAVSGETSMVGRGEDAEGGAGHEVVEVERPRLTEKMVDYVLDELALHAKELDDPHGIRASCFDRIYESDSLVPDSLLSQLKEHVADLEANPPYGSPDFHPGSNDQVLDLVHPSLFPLRYGVTPVRDVDEDGLVMANAGTAPEPRNAVHSTSKKFQWLPSDFDIDESGKTTISSYINGLHPVDHAPLYLVLARLFEHFLPMFERVVSDLQAPPPRRINVDYNVVGSWYGELPDYMDDEQWHEWEESKVLSLPEPAPFDLAVKSAELKRRTEAPVFPLKGRKLQVIVKLANIQLSPDNPDYPGGVWHVEGMQNEEIVASVIYYYDQLNIGESRLAFRGTFADEELPYEQNDVRGVKTVFGIDPEGPCLQYYNSANTCGGRALAFPNIYQHKVSPFSLADPTQPGHRKILVFFLVDPLKPIVSTSRVPPQQRAWVERELPRNERTDKVPVELWDQVLSDVEGLMTYDEAKAVRDELMKERKFLVEENSQKVFERAFSLCEH